MLASKKLGVLFLCKQYFNSTLLFNLYTGFICPCLEYSSHVWGTSLFISLLGGVESKAFHLIGGPPLTSTLDPPSFCHKVSSLSLIFFFFFLTAITLITALMNWLPVFHLRLLDHIPYVGHHLPTIIVCNSPMQEFVSSVMVSSPLFPACGTSPISCFFPASFSLPWKSRSVTSSGTRWHDFFVGQIFFFFFKQVFP